MRSLRTALAVAALLLATPLAAVGQAPESEIGLGLVVELEMTSTAPGLNPQLQQGFENARGILALLASGMDDGRNREETLEAIEGLGPPQTVTQDVTVYVKGVDPADGDRLLGSRIRVDIGENSLLGELTPDGTVSRWAILDPRSGQLMDTDFFDEAVRGRSAAAYEGFGGEADLSLPEVREGGGVREIQGHTARDFTIARNVRLHTMMETEDGGALGVGVSSFITVWVATEGPYTDDRGIVQFFRVFGREMNLHPAMTSYLEVVPPGGIVLEAHEISAITLSDGVGLAQASSSTVVKNISRRELDDDLFAGFDREEKACDCSCSAFKELQAISELPKQEQQNHPKAMSLAMCARECAGRWASFPKSVYEGGACPAGG